MGLPVITNVWGICCQIPKLTFPLNFLNDLFRQELRWLHVLQLVRQVVKRGMPVGFIVRRIVEAICVVGITGMDVFAFYCPNANTFHSPCINVTCIFNGHSGICGMQAAYVFMIKTLFAPDKNFPQWPLVVHNRKWWKERRSKLKQAIVKGLPSPHPPLYF